MRHSLIQTIAGQMEIGAEFSDAYFAPGTGFLCRIHEFDEASDLRKLAESGKLNLVPPITSQDLYLWMVEFASRVNDPLAHAILEHSLKGISAMWKFRNALYRNPELTEKWERFKNKKLTAQAEEWLEFVSRGCPEEGSASDTSGLL